LIVPSTIMALVTAFGAMLSLVTAPSASAEVSTAPSASASPATRLRRELCARDGSVGELRGGNRPAGHLAVRDGPLGQLGRVHPLVGEAERHGPGRAAPGEPRPGRNRPDGRPGGQLGGRNGAIRDLARRNRPVGQLVRLDGVTGDLVGAHAFVLQVDGGRRAVRVHNLKGAVGILDPENPASVSPARGRDRDDARAGVHTHRGPVVPFERQRAGHAVDARHRRVRGQGRGVDGPGAHRPRHSGSKRVGGTRHPQSGQRLAVDLHFQVPRTAVEQGVRKRRLGPEQQAEPSLRERHGRPGFRPQGLPAALDVKEAGRHGDRALCRLLLLEEAGLVVQDRRHLSGGGGHEKAQYEGHEN
jgi:hypothetical protein